MRVDYNEEQLDVGLGVVKNIEATTDDLRSVISSGIDAIKSSAMQYKVNLDGTIEMGNVEPSITAFHELLEQTSNLATTQNGYLKDYESGALAARANDAFISADAFLMQRIREANNKVHPDALTRVAATAGLGAVMFVEGFLGFFEDIGDAVLNVSSAVTSVIGFKSASEQLKALADKELSKNLMENNKGFEWLNKHSYFDKDSAYANVCKGLGKAAAAAVTTHAVSRIGAQYLDKFDKIADIADDASEVERQAKALSQAKETVKKVDKARQVMQSEIDNVKDNLAKGQSVGDAVVNGTAETVGGELTKKYIVKPLAEQTADFVLDTELGRRADEYLRNKGEAIENATNEKIRSAVSNISRTVSGETASEITGAIGDALPHGPLSGINKGLLDETVGEVIDNVGAK